MKSRALSSLAVIIGFSVGFWLYGAVRTMRETVGFDSASFGFGLLLGVVFPLLVVPYVLIARIVGPKLKPWTPPPVFVTFGLALLVGSFLSEGWILRDEWKFSDEVSSLNSPYSRDRAWPNELARLVFIPGQEIHATD